MSRKTWVALLFLFFLFEAFLVIPSTAGGQPPGDDRPLFAPIACSIQSPTAMVGDRLKLQAWVLSEGKNAMTYTWKVNAGNVIGTGQEVMWDLSGVELGDQRATVHAIRKGKEFSCTVEVRVQPSEGIKGGETGFSFLLEGRTEQKGYGLYSYILLGSRPADDESAKRYLKVFEAYILRIEGVLGLEKAGIPKHRLNIMYVPVKKSPGEERPTAEWILSNYDFERARVILSALASEYRQGPYIMSFDRPFFGLPKPSPSCIFQNLSRVPPHVVKLWAEDFMAQAAQERHWEPRTARQLITKTRTAVAVMAEGFGVSRQAVSDFITLKKDLELQ